jgi:Flp pilus assembly protein TadD
VEIWLLHARDAAAVEVKAGAQLSQEKTSLQAATFATNSGKRLLANGDLEGAISQFQVAISSVPTYAPAHYQLAVALAQKGQKDEAGKEFHRASELDSHLVPPH